jgi:hypothetical protein
MVYKVIILKRQFQASISNVSFSLSNNETYLSISLHSRRKSIVFYSRIMAILARMNYATRLRLGTQNTLTSNALNIYWTTMCQ